MPVIKTLRECYEVRDGRRGGEWANITLRCWDNPPHAGTSRTEMYYCGEIVIHSSHGNWANTWTACGEPFKQFLLDVEFDYIFGKFMGNNLHRFDGPATVKQIRQDILTRRRHGELTKFEAKEVWDAVDFDLERLEADEHSYGHTMLYIPNELVSTHPMRDYFADPSGWPRSTHYDRAASNFWRDLWPLFTEALRMELEESATTSIAPHAAPARAGD